MPKTLLYFIHWNSWVSLDLKLWIERWKIGSDAIEALNFHKSCYKFLAFWLYHITTLTAVCYSVRLIYIIFYEHEILGHHRIKKCNKICTVEVTCFTMFLHILVGDVFNKEAKGIICASICDYVVCWVCFREKIDSLTVQHTLPFFWIFCDLDLSVMRLPFPSAVQCFI